MIPIRAFYICGGLRVKKPCNFFGDLLYIFFFFLPYLFLFFFFFARQFTKRLRRPCIRAILSVLDARPMAKIFSPDDDVSAK